MNESRNFRVALLSGGLTGWRDTVATLLLAQTDYLALPDTADELLSLPPASQPEIIFICHQPGNYDGIAAARQIRLISPVTPLVLLAAGAGDCLSDALSVGACAVLEAPFSEPAFSAAFNRCCHVAQALRSGAQQVRQQCVMAELLNQSPFCHLLITGEGRIICHNSEAARIIGIGAGTAPEFSDIVRRFFSPYAVTSPEELELAVQRRSAWNGILSGRLPDATLRVYRVIAVPLSTADGGAGVLVALQDCTDEQAEQTRLRIELQTARDCLALAPPSETASELLQLTARDDKAPPVREVFALSTLLESVTDAANLTIPDYLPKHLRGDAKRLGYALKALFSGSSLYGGREAHLAASLKEQTQTRIVLQLAISVENHAIPSDSFQRCADYLASAGDAPHAADGLGLAQLLIEQLGGALVIRTEREWCRTVSCSVPLLPEREIFPADGDRVPDKAPASLPTLKVLVAEDNLLQQATLKHLLESVGCQVIIVGDGKEAVEEFEQGDFDVVLMDILMPVMDGFEATLRIRERERITGGTVPVVALTSYSLKAIREKCAAVGMNGYLAKPVEKTKLLEALQRLNRPQEFSTPSEVKMSDLQEVAVLDPRSVLENLDYDLDTYRELIDMYLNDFATVGYQLAEKLSGDDLTDIKVCAHGLKGIAASIGGLRLADASNRIQEMCREGVKPDGTVWAPLVKAETAALQEALEQLDQSALEQLAAEQ